MIHSDVSLLARRDGIPVVVLYLEQHSRRRVAGSGCCGLQDPAVLDQQVKRMLADERAGALGTNLAGQWLYLRNVPTRSQMRICSPTSTDNLRQSLQRETELLFESSIAREDRSILDLLTADYTFVNEQVARHYGGILGDQFRRVTIQDEYRKGLLGQASISSSYTRRDLTISQCTRSLPS